MEKLLHAYLKHLRKQPERAKRVHAFSISGIVTVLITVLWLHFHYGLWSSGNEEVYAEDQSYEVRDLSGEVSPTGKEGIASPKVVFKNFFDDLKERVDNLPQSFSGAISDTKTFERQE